MMPSGADPFFRGCSGEDRRREYLNVTLGFLFRAKQYFLFIRLFLYDVATGDRFDGGGRMGA